VIAVRALSRLPRYALEVPTDGALAQTVTSGDYSTTTRATTDGTETDGSEGHRQDSHSRQSNSPKIEE
jgi:hypothetical protein